MFCHVLPWLYGPGCRGDCVSHKLIAGSLTEVFSDSLVNNWISDWKGSHIMPENIRLSKFISTIDPIIVDKEKEQFLLLELHRTSEANTCFFFLPLQNYLISFPCYLMVNNILKSYFWEAGYGQPVRLTTKIQKVIEVGSTKGKYLGIYKDQIIILLSPDH